ncbi:fimbria/pilus outer membrane usher protein [Ideonella sp. 4Y16]|uniref:Fimbria/pilus outer membrane usher protein n=1 Tax=Ideonella aquatica TaxID=2824119 RepID=A0A941BKD9_9BURK|nr:MULTISPECIES: fimbria/pilus outer membrane usher protein [Ideonella]MBQ0946159.1 fimbria/pilus outer membrane usher protein [Ideonella alba]MBQ0960417.1 fimbria/pilus outer membrane usher protein [Ideonella aquatica]
MTDKHHPSRLTWHCRSRAPSSALHPLALAMAAAWAALASPLTARAADAPAGSAVKTAAANAWADFDRNLLMGAANTTIDMARFNRPQGALPGNYRADVEFNQTWLGRFDLRVASPRPGDEPVVCMPRELLQRLGVADEHLSPEGLALLGRGPGAAPACLSLEQAVPGATAAFAVGELRLSLSVPQAYLKRQSRGEVPPESWDEGVPAGRLRYQASHYETRGGSTDSTSTYLGLDAGANAAGWQFRHNGAYATGSGQNGHYGSLNTYLRHNLIDSKSVVTLGDSYTSGRLFDSFALRGAQWVNDERMLPESQRGFAPVIRGMANSNARVEVRQHDQLIYETTVPPGPFEITDLYPTGFGGDLTITVFEADGSRHQSTLAFSAMPALLREGHLNYGLYAGQHRAARDNIQVAQGEWQYGLSNTVTLNAGLQLATHYASALVGTGLNTDWGAWGLDVSASSTTLPGQGRETGSSLRGTWSKVLSGSGTNLSFAAYRYSTEHYYGLTDAVAAANLLDAPLAPASPLPRERTRALFNVSQGLGEWGNVYAQGSRRSFWNLPGVLTTYQLGWSRNLGSAMFNLTLARESSGSGFSSSNTVAASITLPLDGWGSKLPGTASAAISHSSQGGNTEHLSYFGNAGEGNTTTYNLDALRTANGQAVYASGQTRTPVANLNASIGRAQGASQFGASVTGGLVLHPQGLTMAAELGDTVGVVQVEGAQEGIRLGDNLAAAPDRQGYTILPYLVPYQRNDLRLDMSEAPLDVHMQDTQQSVAPTAGAVVMLRFQRDPGRSVLIDTRREDGSALPFGASVLDAQGATVGAVGQASRLQVHLSQTHGQLQVRWGNAPQEVCAIDYTLPERTEQKGFVTLTLPCRAGGSPAPSTPPAAAPQRAAEAPLTRVKVSLRDAQGQPLPKGAMVQVEGQPDWQAVVGEGGAAYLRLSPTGQGDQRLVAEWTDSQGNSLRCATPVADSTRDEQVQCSIKWDTDAKVEPSLAHRLLLGHLLPAR